MYLRNKLITRKAIYDGGNHSKSVHRCANCNLEFDCGIYDCDYTDANFCTRECFGEYNNV